MTKMVIVTLKEGHILDEAVIETRSKTIELTLVLVNRLVVPYQRPSIR